MKKVMASAALVVIAGMLSSCGGPPTDASKSEFCGVFQDFMNDTASVKQGDTKAAVAALKKVAEKLKDVGTPSNISDGARRGFEKTLDLIDGLKDDATESDFENIDKDLTSQEKKDSDAFDSYLEDECGDIAPTSE